jgi:hypothetical protein
MCDPLLQKAEISIEKKNVVLGNLGAKVRAVCEFEFDIFLQHPFTPVLDGDQRHVKVFPSVILTRYQSDAGLGGTSSFATSVARSTNFVSNRPLCFGKMSLPNRACPQEILYADNFFGSNHANNSVNVKSPVITHRSQTDHCKSWCGNDLAGTG